MAPRLWSTVRFLWVVVGMAGAYAAFSPAFRILSVESLQNPSLQWSIITGAVVAFFIGAPWLLADRWLHQQERNARAQKSYASLTRESVRLEAPLVFYLRSFDWDEKFGNEKVHKNLFGPWILWIFFP